MTDPAQIARSLTLLQRSALTTAAIKDGNTLWVGGSNAVLSRLRTKGLAHGMGRFTALGTAVRDYLMQATPDA